MRLKLELQSDDMVPRWSSGLEAVSDLPFNFSSFLDDNIDRRTAGIHHSELPSTCINIAEPVPSKTIRYGTTVALSMSTPVQCFKTPTNSGLTNRYYSLCVLEQSEVQANHRPVDTIRQPATLF